MVTEGKQKSWRPQFSLRMMLFVFMTVAAVGSWYVSILPATFPVPVVMEFDEQCGARATHITVSRNWDFERDVHENEQDKALKQSVAYGLPIDKEPTSEQLHARKVQLLEDLRAVNFRRDVALIEANRAEFEEAARKDLKTATGFTQAANAAGLLHFLGDKEQFPAIVQRYLNDGSKPSDLQYLIFGFSFCDDAPLLESPAIVNSLRAHSNDAALPGRDRLYFAEQLAKIDPAIVRGVHRALAFENMERSSIEWLLVNEPDEECLRLAIKLLSDPKNQRHWYRCGGLMKAVLGSADKLKGNVESWNEFALLAIELAKRNAQLFRSLIDHGGEDFKPFLEATIESPEYKWQLSSAIYGLRSQQSKSEFEALLDRKFRSSKYAESIFSLYVEVHGLEKAIEILKSRWQIEKAHWQLRLICENSEDSEGEDLLEMLKDGFERSLTPDPNLPGYYGNRKPLDVLHFLRKFGHRELALEYSQRVSAVDEFWFDDSRKAQVFVDWFNDHFELENPLSVKEVIAKDSGFNTQLEDQYGAFAPHFFGTAVIQASGIGRVIDPECWGLNSSFFAEIAELSGDKFQVQSHDITDDKHIRLLIDNRVYSFTLEDNWTWYNNEPACEILNAILERKQIKERFFVFQYVYGNSYVKLVMFALPDKIKSFTEKYKDFETVPGCEKYWAGEAK